MDMFIILDKLIDFVVALKQELCFRNQKCGRCSISRVSNGVLGVV